MFALLQNGIAELPVAYIRDVPWSAPAPIQTEVLPSSIMMLSEAIGGEADLSPSPAPPEQPTGGAPCPKCGKALGRRGRHFHIRKCYGP